VSLVAQGIGNDKAQQPTAGDNSLLLIGKDEVGSSNLPSSSKKITRNLTVSGDFLFILL